MENMKPITDERFIRIWEECRKECYKKGDLFIDDWTAMCYGIDEYSEENGMDKVEDGDMFTTEAHKAFIAGAQWAFKYLKVDTVKDETESEKEQYPPDKYNFGFESKEAAEEAGRKSFRTLIDVLKENRTESL
jgi:hypothetical protein